MPPYLFDPCYFCSRPARPESWYCTACEPEDAYTWPSETPPGDPYSDLPIDYLTDYEEDYS